MNNLMLTGKKILVTGASSGIGRAVAVLFSQYGAQLIITGRDTRRLLDTYELLSGVQHHTILADLSSIKGVEKLMQSAHNFVGALDCIVHCAGIQQTLPLQSVKENNFESIISTNVKSAQFLTKELRKKGRYNINGTSIIFMSSVAAICGEAALSTYAASKAALLGLSKSLAVELARQKIRVNCIVAGHVMTEMSTTFNKKLTAEQYNKVISLHPLGVGKAEDIANAAFYLASDLSRWVTGSELNVDGGYSAK